MGPLGLALCALLLYGCSASASRGDTQGGPQVANLAPEQCLENAAIQSASDQQNYHIQRGDRLAINFYLNPEFNTEAPVGPDGRITLPLIGSLAAAGMTPADLAQQIDKGYLSELRSPDAAVVVKNMPGRQVYVQGQVNRPGAFPLAPGMTALQAFADAGGVTDGSRQRQRGADPARRMRPAHGRTARFGQCGRQSGQGRGRGAAALRRAGSAAQPDCEHGSVRQAVRA